MRQKTLQMTVRPPVEELYDNLEKYFPHTNLDKPIIDEESPEQPIKEKSRLFRGHFQMPIFPLSIRSKRHPQIMHGSEE